MLSSIFIFKFEMTILVTIKKNLQRFERFNLKGRNCQESFKWSIVESFGIARHNNIIIIVRLFYVFSVLGDGLREKHASLDEYGQRRYRDESHDRWSAPYCYVLLSRSLPLGSTYYCKYSLSACFCSFSARV